jgi:hypothetical protein
MLPLELQDFRNVFKDLEKLRLVLDIKHKINTSSNLPFKLIYNFFTCKLAMLCAYLDIALEKG